MNKIIEFNGVPGSGKSTIANNIRLSNKDILFTNDIKKHYFNNNKIKTLYYFIRYADFKLFILLLYSIIKLKLYNKDSIVKIKNTYGIAIMYKIINDKFNNKVIIADRGIIQEIILMIYTKSNINYLYVDKLFKYVFSKYKLYIVNCKLEVEEIISRCNKRMKDTDKTKIAMSKEHFRLRVKKNREVHEHIWNLVKSLDSIKYIDIDTNLEKEKNANIIYNEFIG